MGYALAREASLSGAVVTLITGPTNLECPPCHKRVDVETAQEMFAAVTAQLDGQDVFISVAAVSDYRVVNIAHHKIKKDVDPLILHFIPDDNAVSIISHDETISLDKAPKKTIARRLLKMIAECIQSAREDNP